MRIKGAKRLGRRGGIGGKLTKHPRKGKGDGREKDGSSFRGELTRERGGGPLSVSEPRLSRSVNQSVTPRRYGRLNPRNRIARLNCLLDYGVS